MDIQCSEGIKKQPRREKTTAKQRFDPSICSAHDGSCHHVAAGESSTLLGGKML